MSYDLLFSRIDGRQWMARREDGSIVEIRAEPRLLARGVFDIDLDLVEPEFAVRLCGFIGEGRVDKTRDFRFLGCCRAGDDDQGHCDRYQAVQV